MNFLVINGVNLGLTGRREREIYGEETLEEIERELISFAAAHGHTVTCMQSDLEGEICKALHGAEGYDGVILNAGAYAHYSYAIRDAIAAVSVPVVEVHMSNIFAREEFRRTSILSEVCRGEVIGFGKNSYLLALESFWL